MKLLEGLSVVRGVSIALRVSFAATPLHASSSMLESCAPAISSRQLLAAFPVRKTEQYIQVKTERMLFQQILQLSERNHESTP